MKKIFVSLCMLIGVLAAAQEPVTETKIETSKDTTKRDVRMFGGKKTVTTTTTTRRVYRTKPAQDTTGVAQDTTNIGVTKRETAYVRKNATPQTN